MDLRKQRKRKKIIKKSPNKSCEILLSISVVVGLSFYTMISSLAFVGFHSRVTVRRN